MRSILLPGEFVQSELEVDEREQKGEEPVETKVDGFAAIVMLEEFFAKLVNDDDPEEPGEEKTESGNEGSDGPIQGTGAVVDFANPEAEVERPRNRNGIDGKISERVRNEPESERLSRNKRK